MLKPVHQKIQPVARAFMRYSIIFMILLSAAHALAAEKQNFFITTGPEVREAPFQRFVFNFSVDSSYQGDLFVRIFDADFGGTLDLDYKNSKTRYLIYGGQSVTENLRQIDEPLPSQPPLATLELGENQFYDNRWRTLATLHPVDGKLLDGRILFQLVVDGIAGPGSNKFQLFISSQDKKNTAIPDLRLYAPAVNVQVPDAAALDTEIRFTVPATSQYLKITNFDADADRFGARINFSSPLRPRIPLRGSSNDASDFSKIPLLEEEKGNPAAILLSSAQVNYVQFWLEDDQNRSIPLELPLFLASANHVPEPKIKIIPLSACNTVVLDASDSVDQDDDQLAFQWRFADGSTATGSRITHDFSKPGTYTAQVTVQDDSEFVANRASKDFSVTINAQPTAKIVAPPSAVPGEKVFFDGSGSNDPDGKLIRYRWNFEKDREDNGPTIAYSFARPGLYKVRLMVEDNGPGLCTTDQTSQNILINAAPLAKFTFKKIAAPGEEVLLDASDSLDSDGTIAAYTWNFGTKDSKTGSGETVKHAWQEPGVYTVHLQVDDDSGLSNGISEAVGTIVINAAPEPVITASNLVVAAESEIVFSGTKSRDTDGKISSYTWDFGDTSTEQGEQVGHAYKKPGLYTVRLTTKDDSGVSNADQFCEETVRVNAPPVPVITAPEMVNTSQVAFDASKSSDVDDKIIAYDWDFGDGSKGNGVNVSHVYPLPGTYTVQLHVTDASGCASAVQSIQKEIRVNAPPVADAGPDQLIAPGGTVHFDGRRSVDPDGTIRSYTWQIEGQQYTEEKLSHQFDQAGQYQVGLTVVDNDGASHSDYLTVTVNSQPIARIQPLPRLEPGKEVLFNAEESTDADGSIAAYHWDFGDGSKAEGKQVKHIYAEPGRYQAVLTVHDASGAANDLATTKQTVAVNFPPVADAGKDVTTCEQLIQFDGSGSTDPDQDPLAYTWDFGDQSTSQGVAVQHQFASPGLYPVRLQVDDKTGLGNSTDSKQLTVQINNPPEAVISTAGDLFCVGEHVLFDGSQSRDPEGSPLRYLWNLGDGKELEGVSPIRVYEKAGSYPVNLTVFDDSGLACNSGHARKNIQLIAAPIARAGEDIEVCSNAPVAFDGSQSDGGERPITNYFWDFGDGSSDVLVKTNHIYKEPGQYIAKLTVRTPELSRCDNQAEDERKIEVIAAPRVDFKAADGCVGQTMSFDASESAAINGDATQYSWDFGDGMTGAGVNAEHSYSRAGRYTVRLNVASRENTVCNSSERSQEIKINQAPVARIRWTVAGKAMNFETPQAILPNTLLHFSASESMDEDGVIKKLLWDFGDGQEAEGWFVQHSFTQPGQYTVRLTAVDDTELSCNTSSTELSVIVVEPPVFQIQGPKQVCVNQSVRYALEGEAGQVSWDFGRNQTTQGKEVRAMFTQAGLREIHTIVDGQPGPVQIVQVLALPDFGLPEQITVVAGETLRITPIALQDTGLAPQFTWESGDGKTSTGLLFEHVYNTPGSYTAQLHMRGTAEEPDCLRSNKEVTITVLPPPAIKIQAEPEQVFSGGARDEVFFQAERMEGSGNWTYHWDFGDKTTTEGASVSHVFQKPGTYTVTLTATNGSGLSKQPYSFTQQITVQVHGK